MLEPPAAEGKECANLFHVKRRMYVAQFDHNHVGERCAGQQSRGPHFTLACRQPLDPHVGGARA